MNARLAIALIAAAAIGSLSAVNSAQAQVPGQKATPSANQTIYSPAVQPNPPAPPSTPAPLFDLGNLPVGVWAPVEPPYDVHANRNNASNPLWYDASSTW